MVLISVLRVDLLIFFILICALVGSLGGFNQRSIKKIVTYSSIIHSRWLIVIVLINIKLWINYFLIYSTITICFIVIISSINIERTKRIIYYKNRLFYKLTFSINILSLGGMPPFLGFLGKFILITFLIKNSFNIIIMLILITTSILGLFFYIKIVYSFIMVNSTTLINTALLKKVNIDKQLIIVISLMLNCVVPFIVILT